MAAKTTKATESAPMPPAGATSATLEHLDIPESLEPDLTEPTITPEGKETPTEEKATETAPEESQRESEEAPPDQWAGFADDLSESEITTLREQFPDGPSSAKFAKHVFDLRRKMGEHGTQFEQLRNQIAELRGRVDAGQNGREDEEITPDESLVERFETAVADEHPDWTDEKIHRVAEKRAQQQVEQLAQLNAQRDEILRNNKVSGWMDSYRDAADEIPGHGMKFGRLREWLTARLKGATAESLQGEYGDIEAFVAQHGLGILNKPAEVLEKWREQHGKPPEATKEKQAEQRVKAAAVSEPAATSPGATRATGKRAVPEHLKGEWSAYFHEFSNLYPTYPDGRTVTQSEPHPDWVKEQLGSIAAIPTDSR